MFCDTLLCVLSSFAIILMGKRELVALLCLPGVLQLLLTVPFVGLQCVIVVFSDHTHFFFILNHSFKIQKKSGIWVIMQFLVHRI